MNCTTTSAAAAAAVQEREGFPYAVSPTSASASSPLRPPATNLSPCAACKTLRRRCAEKCLLAPYFPPTEPLKFAMAHRIFGASNITRLLQELPEGQRADAVNSMVYEANARLRDPIYGCTRTICHLQKQIDELQVELARAHAEILNMQCQNANLLDVIICRTMAPQDVQENIPLAEMQYHENSKFFFS